MEVGYYRSATLSRPFVRHPFSKSSRSLSLLLKLNLALLSSLIVLAFFLPLSSSERWILVLSDAVLLGITWALLAHANNE